MNIRSSPIACPPAPHLGNRTKEAEERIIHEPQNTFWGHDYSIVVLLLCKLTCSMACRQEPCYKDEVPSSSATWREAVPCGFQPFQAEDLRIISELIC
jgi:hypothetical protein